jgi:hypothetical protein
MGVLSSRQEDSMIQIDFNPWMDVEVRQHQEELQQEAAIRNLLDVAHRTRRQKISVTDDLLALIGKGLMEYGIKLQRRYGNQPDAEKPNTQQRNMKGNSPEGR